MYLKKYIPIFAASNKTNKFKKVRHTVKTVKIMKTIENLLQKIQGADVHVAGTGTIYVYYDGKKVRIADHEPNYNAPNRSNDKCFYTKSASNEKYDIYDVVEQVCEYLGIEIKGTLKAAFTRHYNEQMKVLEEIQKYQAAQRQEQAEYEAKREIENNRLNTVINENKAEVEAMLNEAEEYGDLASNGKKRRERTRKYFKRAFVERFGFDPVFSDVKISLNK